MDVLTPLMIAGGVALIVFGVRFLRRGLDRLFGARLRHWIQRLTGNRLRAFLSGFGIALIAPSSTTLSFVCVQTLQAGHATSRQMLALMFGADIGMTVMVVLLAFQFEQYAPILMLAGVPFYYFTRAPRRRGLGQVVLSLGFIFMGVDTIKKTIEQSPPDESLIRLIEAAAAYPFMLMIISAVIAVSLQSSTATIAMLIALAVSDQIHLTTSQLIAIVSGANIGVAVTMLLIGYSHLESRRLAWGNLIVKALVAMAALEIMDTLAQALEGSGLTLAIQIAAAHTGFNVIVALIGVPLVGPIDWLTGRIAPANAAPESEPFGPRYISKAPADSVALAIGQSMREILRVAEIVREMFSDLWRALETNDQKLNRDVGNRDDNVDLLDTLIKRFLTQLSVLDLDRDDAAEQMHQLRYLNELESIGDIIDKNLSQLVAKKIRNRIEFSKEGWQELCEFYGMVAENMLIAETAFGSRDRMLARTLLRHKERIDTLERDLRDRHFNRLRTGTAETHVSSAVHLDILTHVKRINSCVTHVGHAILQGTEDVSPA